MFARAVWGHFLVFLWVLAFMFIFKFAVKQFQATAWIADEV